MEEAVESEDTLTSRGVCGITSTRCGKAIRNDNEGIREYAAAIENGIMFIYIQGCGKVSLGTNTIEYTVERCRS